MGAIFCWISANIQPILSAIEIVVMAVSARAVVRQLRLTKEQLSLTEQQIKDSHDEHRREKTVDTMFTWCESLLRDTALAEQVTRKLSTEQCQCLYEQRPFNVTPEVKSSLCKFCPFPDAECEKCSLKEDSTLVDGKIHTELRHHVMKYLNTLETIMVAWQLGIIDRKTIEEQFKFLIADGKGEALHNLRDVAGGYPAIGEFLSKIKPPAKSARKEL